MVSCSASYLHPQPPPMLFGTTLVRRAHQPPLPLDGGGCGWGCTPASPCVRPSPPSRPSPAKGKGSRRPTPVAYRTILALPRRRGGFREVVQIIAVGAMSHWLPRIILDDGYARQGHSAVSRRYAQRARHPRRSSFDTLVPCLSPLHTAAPDEGQLTLHTRVTHNWHTRYPELNAH
jgi:hypothetical protein